MTHATVKPVRLRLHNPMLEVDVLRTVGYRARFADGTRGPTRKTMRAARLDARTSVKAST